VRLFVPGRLCLFGEHADWAGGYRRLEPALAPGHCLVAGTDQGLAAEVAALPERVELSSIGPDGRPATLRLPASVDALDRAARAGGFLSYAAGTAAEVTARHRVGGVRVDIVAADLPAGKGLSSSAAVCVLVARAYGLLYGLELTTRMEMELAWAGERRAGSACGRMDQICAYGRRTVLLTFDGDGVDVEPLSPGGPFWLLVVDLRRGKDTRRILADLNACYPATAGEVAAGVRRALGPLNVTLVGRARQALLAGDAPALGALMTEAQDVFDRLVAPASPALAAPRLHEVLRHPAVRELGWGGKGVGSQGDGAAQLVARGPQARDALAARLARELDVGCLPLTIEPAAG
jgi:mevalonate kinase